MWPPDDVTPEQAQWIKLLVFAIFAAVGGFLGHVVRCFEHDSRFSWTKSFIAAFASGFVGILMVLLCRALKLDDTWTGVIAGTAGWLGADATIQIIASVVRKKLGVDKDPVL